MTTPVLPDQTVRARPPQGFYEAGPAELEGDPGSLIRAIRLDAPRGIRAWAVLYRSTGADGSIVPVSGLVLAPRQREEPAGAAPTPTFGIEARPILAWAHGTTGLADDCAPSREGAAGLGYEPFLDLVRAGFTITATDYEGLGTAGIHPYLVGASEGRSILDSIRAASALLDALDGSALDRAVVVGISQGGHAALWAGEIEATYAPELSLAGIVAASPPIDLQAVQRAVLGSDDAGEAAWLEALMVAAAWQQVYDADLDGLLTQEAMRVVRQLEDRCPSSIAGPSRSPFRVDPADVPEWQALLAANSAGQRAARAPVLVLAATRDDLVPSSTIQPAVDRMCAAGSSVDLRWIDGGHASTLGDPAAATLALSWSIDRLRGLPASGGCS